MQATLQEDKAGGAALVSQAGEERINSPSEYIWVVFLSLCQRKACNVLMVALFPPNIWCMYLVTVVITMPQEESIRSLRHGGCACHVLLLTATRKLQEVRCTVVSTHPYPVHNQTTRATFPLQQYHTHTCAHAFAQSKSLQRSRILRIAPITRTHT